ncbi:GntR family transcriptional regulator [Tuberibacillus sp. Marseille-P3662]|uniref:GntR family transcriptional regulator n=1 Tax=Tuberibacillus sp. Marseille-P3662 TaxID=1965358 RepID=UPI00111BF245
MSPGHQIPSENQLMQRYNVSRTTIQQAIHQSGKLVPEKLSNSVNVVNGPFMNR